MSKIRTWLETNKVFFEVFQNVVLGIGGIIIGILSFHLSNEEHVLNQVKSLPAFKISMNPYKSSNTNFYDTYNLEIDNAGERLSDFNCDVYTFLTIDQTCGRCRAHTNFKMQINDWYTGIYYTNNLTGKLVGSIGEGNNLRLYKLQEAGRTPKPLSETYIIDLVTYLKLTYKDIEDIQHVEYWQVGFLNANKIPIEKFKAATYKNSDSLNFPHPSLYNLKLQDIDDEYSNISNQSKKLNP